MPQNPSPVPQETPETKDRLPDQSAFFVRYDATAVRWTGSLIVPGCKPFEGTATGVFPLLKKLDRQYRAWAKSQEGT